MKPESIIYKKITLGARDAADGETPSSVVLTEETNGFAIWEENATDGLAFVRFYLSFERTAAIEYAVKFAEAEASRQQEEAAERKAA